MIFLATKSGILAADELKLIVKVKKMCVQRLNVWIECLMLHTAGQIQYNIVFVSSIIPLLTLS